MADERCPDCGKELPSELGQHSSAPLTGLATCPHCGADVHVPKPGASTHEASGGGGQGQTETSSGREEVETFSGHETVEGVMQEVEEKNQEGTQS